MANISLTRVNQKLAQARALLTSAGDSPLVPIHLAALQEAVVFHLVCAYRHYLREIAETYGLKQSAGIATESDLAEAFRLAKKHPAEADELIALRENKGAWLGQLHSYYETLWSVPVLSVATVEAKIERESEESASIIKLVNIDPAPALVAVDMTLLASWHVEFVALVGRQRETSAEF
ncbi:MAG TPA: DUF6586 family protein [Cellvibrio sp.]|nr:DUF6586 family protein [Cellvibrio sp.]